LHGQDDHKAPLRAHQNFTGLLCPFELTSVELVKPGAVARSAGAYFRSEQERYAKLAN
jgi:hypothetical protein